MHTKQSIPPNVHEAWAGQVREAVACIADIKRVSPNYTIAEDYRSNFKNPEDRERFHRGLQQAGLS